MKTKKKLGSLACVFVLVAGAVFLPAAYSPAMAQDNHAADYMFDKERTIFLTGDLTDEKAQDIISRMRLLDSRDPKKPITLHVMSEGGSVNAAMSIYDHSRMIKAPIRTLCAGEASSAAMFVLATVGSPGMREALPNCRIMMHEMSWEGDAKTLSQTRDKHTEMMKNEHDWNGILSQHSGWSRDALALMQERRDLYMSAQQAKEMGFIDTVLAPLSSKQVPVPPEKLKYPRWLCEKMRNPAPYCS